MSDKPYKVLSIDAWRDGPGWTWNQWYHVGTIPKLPDTTRKLLRALREAGFLCAASAGKVYVEDDQLNKVVCARATGEPLFAVEYATKEHGW